MLLPLHGVALRSQGFDNKRRWQLLRLRSPHTMPSHPADAALIRLPQDVPAARSSGFATALVVDDSIHIENGAPPELAVVANRFDYLSDGDVLGFQPLNGRFRTLYRKASAHNSFLVTERCNHYCLMCSQPPRDIDDRWVLDQIKAAVELVDPQTQSFAFTGGEPLLEWRSFVELLEHCRKMLPSTSIHVLTNGRAFAKSEITAAWASVDHPKLTAGIPIYSAVDHIHDYVVQTHGAFDETVLGILKLKDRGQRVEVRVVLHAITAPRIVETCRWLGRNLPFIDHVALMGLENTGFTLANSELLWIDPVDYGMVWKRESKSSPRQKFLFQFTICRVAYFPNRFGPTPFSRFQIGKTDM